MYQRFIFQIFWKIIKEKDWCDPQPDSAIQPKARGLLHMEREYFAHHIWSRFRGLSTSQPRSNRRYLEDYLTYLKEGLDVIRRMFWLLEVFEDSLPSTRRLQDSATKSSGACQNRGSGTAHRHRTSCSTRKLPDRVVVGFQLYSARTFHVTLSPRIYKSRQGPPRNNHQHLR